MTTAYDSFGVSVAIGGDLDQDGLPDLAAGAYANKNATGRAFIFRGAPDDTSAPTDNDGDGVPAEEDCDDNNASVFPGAAETCDGLDNNCDGSVDEGALSTFYVDADGDGYGDTAQPIEACEAPEGASALGDDCDDEDAAFNPGASETDCDDPNDYNCDGSTGFADGDGDGFAACQECDDGDAAVNPDAAEVCDERDNNCDGATDEGVTSTFYQDRDADTYGDVDFPAEACSAPSGYTADSTDCDDDAGAVNPGATEVCNDLDDDCDALIDGDDDSLDSASATSFYSDEDGDGYGDPASVVLACDAPSGAVTDNTDCDDSESDVYPGAVETCDGEDDDCDGSVDEEATGLRNLLRRRRQRRLRRRRLSTVEACSPPTGYVANTDGLRRRRRAGEPGGVRGLRQPRQQLRRPHRRLQRHRRQDLLRRRRRRRRRRPLVHHQGLFPALGLHRQQEGLRRHRRGDLLQGHGDLRQPRQRLRRHHRRVRRQRRQHVLPRRRQRRLRHVELHHEVLLLAHGLLQREHGLPRQRQHGLPRRHRGL
jgi:hypothetical protein